MDTLPLPPRPDLAQYRKRANGLLDLVKRLLTMHVPLEPLNRWEGTVLDSTARFAAYMPVDGVDYSVVFKLLIHAGADVGVLAPYPAGTKAIDDVRRSQGIPDSQWMNERGRTRTKQLSARDSDRLANGPRCR